MRIRFRLIIGVLAAALLVSACGDPPPKTKDADADSVSDSIVLAKDYDTNAEFTFAYYYKMGAFTDPIKSSGGLDQTYMSPVYDRLIYLAPDGQYEPMLATSWEQSADGMSITLKLRENLTFSDGTPFDAAAVKVNLDRARGSDSTLKNELTMLTGVEVVDPLTVKLTVSSGLGALLAALSQRPGMVVSPAAIASGAIQSQMIGIGAYTVTKLVPGDRIYYTKTEGYWDPDAQKVASMMIQSIPDDQARYNALQSGEVLGATLQPEQVTTAKGTKMDVIGKPGWAFDFFAVNTSLEPFTDPKVREALKYAIDRKAIGEGLLSGFCAPQIQPWPENSSVYNKDIGDGLDKWPYDPAKAKKMLADAGHADGVTFTASSVNGTARLKMMEALQSQMKEAGFNMELNPVPGGGPLLDYFGVGKSSPGVGASYTGGPYPAGVIDRNLAPNATYNPGGEFPGKLAELAELGASALDPAKQGEKYAQFTEEFVDSSTHFFPICAGYTLLGLNDEVSNISAPAAGAVDLRGIAVKKV